MDDYAGEGTGAGYGNTDGLAYAAGPSGYWGTVSTPPWAPAYRGRAGICRTGMRADTCAAQLLAYGFSLPETIAIMAEADAEPEFGVAEPRRHLTVGAPRRFTPGWSVESTVGPAVVRAWRAGREYAA